MKDERSFNVFDSKKPLILERKRNISLCGQISQRDFNNSIVVDYSDYKSVYTI